MTGTKKRKKSEAEVACSANKDLDDDGNFAKAPSSEDKEEDIDDIFAELKEKKKKLKFVGPNKKKLTSEKDDERWKEPKVHRFTTEGLPIYKYYHLGVNQNDGGTPLCPFDCDCCF